MGANLAADAVFERGDDFAARRVVLGVGGEDDGDVELEADGVALNLDVAFLHDVEERDLDFAREIGELVDGEDAAVGAGQQAVVHGELGAELVAGARGLDGVDIADEVGDGDVGRGELFDVALDGRHPGDGRVVAERGDEVARKFAQRSVGVVAELGAGDVGRVGVEQRGERAQDAGLGLAAQAEQDEVVAREDGVDDLRDDRVVVADDAGEEAFAFAWAAGRDLPQTRDEIVAELVLDGARDALGGEVRRFAKLAQCGRKRVLRHRYKYRCGAGSRDSPCAPLGRGSRRSLFFGRHFAVGERVAPDLMVTFPG